MLSIYFWSHSVNSPNTLPSQDTYAYNLQLVLWIRQPINLKISISPKACPSLLCDSQRIRSKLYKTNFPLQVLTCCPVTRGHCSQPGSLWKHCTDFLVFTVIHNVAFGFWRYKSFLWNTSVPRMTSLQHLVWLRQALWSLCTAQTPAMGNFKNNKQCDQITLFNFRYLWTDVTNSNADSYSVNIGSVWAIIHGILWEVVGETITWSKTRLPFHASNPALC